MTLPNAGAFASSCVVRFEEVDANNTRITPDCGETGAAITDVGAEYFELEIAALIDQMLTGNPVDAEHLGKEMAMVMLKKMPDIQKNGFAPDEKWVREQQAAAVRRVETEQAGWGDNAAGSAR